MKSILLLGALLLLFVGNVGVNIFKHICKEDGVLVSYFVDNSDEHCADEQSALPVCCQKEKKSDKKDDCCSDEVEYFKIKLDFYDSYSVDVPQAWSANVPDYFAVNTNPILFDTYKANYIDPPPISSREILILNQVFII